MTKISVTDYSKDLNKKANEFYCLKWSKDNRFILNFVSTFMCNGHPKLVTLVMTSATPLV